MRNPHQNVAAFGSWCLYLSFLSVWYVIPYDLWFVEALLHHRLKHKKKTFHQLDLKCSRLLFPPSCHLNPWNYKPVLEGTKGWFINNGKVCVHFRIVTWCVRHRFAFIYRMFYKFAAIAKLICKETWAWISVTLRKLSSLKPRIKSLYLALLLAVP